MSDDAMPAWAQAMEERLSEQLWQLGRDLQDRNALARAADGTAAASLERDLARSKTQAALSEAVGSLLARVSTLEDQLRELREGKAP